MEKVKVNREELLSILNGNRDKHKQEFEEAVTGWKEQALEAMKNAVAEFENDNFHTTHPLVTLPKPTAHLRDYDLAIRMLEMSVDTDIEIEQHDFNCFVMDEWQWKAGFAQTVSNYTNIR
jgi:proteasome lid subunit RPN8/RPN11